MAADLIAVEIDLFDHTDHVTKTLRLCNFGPLVRTADGERVQYDPRLNASIPLGSRISGDAYGSPVRGAPNAGNIGFAIDDVIRSYLGYSWLGRACRIYAGEDTRWEHFQLVANCRVAGLSHDTTRATVAVTDASLDLDNALVSDLYLDAEEAVQGRPKPQLWGTARNLAPVLEDAASQLYRVSRNPTTDEAKPLPNLAEISEVRVGGIAWDFRLVGEPAQGEWSRPEALFGGTLRLGSVPLNGELRCDAKAAGFETLTSAALIRLIVTGANATVDETALAALDLAAPYRIGYFARDPVNRQEAMDQIMSGVGGWWAVAPSAAIVAGVIAAPDADTVVASLSEVDIAAFSLVQIDPPAWRIRVEYARNWQPETQFLPAVTEAEQQGRRASGIVGAPYQNDTTKANEPRAVDVPLIRSLVDTAADALAIRDRLVEAWGVERRLYDISAWVDGVQLYDTIRVDYQGVVGVFRVHSIVRALGGGPAQLQVWG